MKKIPFYLLFFVCCFCLRPPAHSDDWQIVNVDGKDYLSLDNVAKFYQLSSSTGADPQHVTLADSRSRIETLTNSRELLINGVKEWLSFPTVLRDGQTLVSRFDLSKTIEPCLRPAMIGNLEPFQTVVLDAGHGGQDGGGSSATGLEKNYTLDVIRDLKASLEAKGLQVILTRSDDAYLGLEQRAELANTISNAVFVSVHFNSSGDVGAGGLEVYAMTPRGAASTGDHNVALDQTLQMPGNDFDNASLALANCVHHSLLGKLPIGDRGVRRARFAVLRLTHAPSILVEGGYMTNGEDSRQINDPAWRQKLAEAIATGVRSFQDVVQYKQAPKLLADYRAELPVVPAVVKQTPPVYAFHPPRPKSALIAVSNPAPTRRQAPLRPAGRTRRAR